MGIGNILKSLRTTCKFSQQHVADFLNISRNAYMAWENGDTRLNMKKLLLICELYQISLQELLIHGDELIARKKKVEKRRIRKPKLKVKTDLLEYLPGNN